MATFLAQGLDAVTVDAITQRAGMAKGSFYRYFDDVEALVAHVIGGLAADVRGAFRRCAVTLAQATTRAALVSGYQLLAAELAAAVYGSRDAARLYLQEARGVMRGPRRPIAKLAKDVRRGAVELTDAAQRHGLLRVASPLVTSHAVVGAVEELVFEALARPRRFGDPDAVAAALVTLVLDGLRAR